MLNDLRYALRQLRKSPGFTATAVLTLGLGVGASTGVFAVVRSVLLSPLPYPDPARLVGIAFTFPQEKPNAEQTGTSADFVRDHTNAFDSTAVMDDNSPAVNLSIGGGRAIQVSSLRVSQGYFRTLGVAPALGREFTAEEDRAAGPRSAILSQGLWVRQFSRDPGVVGRAVRINQETYTVAGVMPESFVVSAETAPGVMGTPDVWLPLQLGPKDPGYDGTNYEMIARLRPGVTLAQAQQQVSALTTPFYAQFPDFKTWYSSARQQHELRVWPLRDVVASSARRSLLTLLAAVLAVLLMACLNLAGLMMARAMRRQQELSLRTALGATRTQLLRLISAEGLLLALGGAVLAVLIARISTALLLNTASLPISRLAAVPGTGALLLVALPLAVITMLLFAVVPAWLVLRNRAGEARFTAGVVSESSAQSRLSRLLVVAQIAVAMVLVSTASILLGTFVRLRALPAGIEPKQVSIFQVALKGARYANTQHEMQFVQTVLDQLRSTPGVDRVAAINGLPLDRGLNIGGNPSSRHELRQTLEFRAVTPDYFEALGMRLLSGRTLTESDNAQSDPVIVIGETAARKWWPGRSPIGETIHIGHEKHWRIVGVVNDAQMHSLVESRGIVIYAPIVQLSNEFTGILNGWFPTTFVVRTEANISVAMAAQRAVAAADPEIPVTRLSTMQSVIDSTIDAPRFFSMLATSFSAFALVLTIIGLFGLLSYQVTQRTREIGLRMALGANRSDILAGFLRRGLALALLGVLAGFVATQFAGPVVHRLLSEAGIDSGTRSIVLSGTSAALAASIAVLAASIVASWLPARRAASIEPMQALRTE